MTRVDFLKTRKRESILINLICESEIRWCLTESGRRPLIFDIRRNQWNEIKFFFWNVCSQGFIFLQTFVCSSENSFHSSLTLKKFHSFVFMIKKRKKKKSNKSFYKNIRFTPVEQFGWEDFVCHYIISCIWSTDWHISSDLLICKWLVPDKKNEKEKNEKITECHVCLSLINFKSFSLMAKLLKQLFMMFIEWCSYLH